MDQATQPKRARRKNRKKGANKDMGGVKLVMRDSRRIPTSAEQGNRQQSSQSAQNMGTGLLSSTVERAGATHMHGAQFNGVQTVPVGPAAVGPVASMSNMPTLGLPQPNRSGIIQLEERTSSSHEYPLRSRQPSNNDVGINQNYAVALQNQPAFPMMPSSFTLVEHSTGFLQMGLAGQGMVPGQSQVAYHQYLTGNPYANLYSNMQFQAAFSPYANWGFALPDPALQPLRLHHTMSMPSTATGPEPGYVVPLTDEQWKAPSPTPSTLQRQETPSEPPEVLPKKRGPKPRPVTPPPTPIPTEEYTLQANQPPRRLQQPQHLLLVIDLNGTLLYRPNRNNSSKLVARPGIKPFLTYILSNFKIMIWSSSRARNVAKMCKEIFSGEQAKLLITCWGRETLGLTEKQYNNKVQVYKRLEWVWENADIAASHPDFHHGEKWGQSNTVLIDDTVLKGAGQPYNILEVPEFAGKEENRNKDTLEKVTLYLEELRFQEDVSAFMRASPFVIDGSWRKE